MNKTQNNKGPETMNTYSKRIIEILKSSETGMDAEALCYALNPLTTDDDANRASRITGAMMTLESKSVIKYESGVWSIA